MKELRVNKGYTQEYMAEKLNIKQSTYCLKENGKRRFNLTEILKLKEILEVNLEELLEGVN